MRSSAIGVLALTVVGLRLGCIATEPKAQATPYPPATYPTEEPDKPIVPCGERPVSVSLR